MADCWNVGLARWEWLRDPGVDRAEFGRGEEGSAELDDLVANFSGAVVDIYRVQDALRLPVRGGEVGDGGVELDGVREVACGGQELLVGLGLGDDFVLARPVLDDITPEPLVSDQIAGVSEGELELPAAADDGDVLLGLGVDLDRELDVVVDRDVELVLLSSILARGGTRLLGVESAGHSGRRKSQRPLDGREQAVFLREVVSHAERGLSIDEFRLQVRVPQLRFVRCPEAARGGVELDTLGAVGGLDDMAVVLAGGLAEFIEAEELLG